MSEFVNLGTFDGISVSYTTATPCEPVVAVPEPEEPPHVLANYQLSRELEGDYFAHLNRFKAKRVHSSHARKHFFSEQERKAYFDELAEANAGIEAREPKPKPREMTYEDVIRSWGGRNLGESQVLPGRVGNSRSADSGIV